MTTITLGPDDTEITLPFTRWDDLPVTSRILSLLVAPNEPGGNGPVIQVPVTCTFRYPRLWWAYEIQETDTWARPTTKTYYTIQVKVTFLLEDEPHATTMCDHLIRLVVEPATA